MWLAELTWHIPPKATLLIHRYRLCSSRNKGRLEDMDDIGERLRKSAWTLLLARVYGKLKRNPSVVGVTVDG